MSNTTRDLILYSTLLILGVCAFVWGLVVAQSYLVPLTLAALLAMLVMPVSNWLERRGLGRGLASLLSTLVILLCCALMVGGLGLQMRNFVTDWPEMKKRIIPQVEKAQQEIADRTGFTVKQQNEKIGLDMVDNSAEQPVKEGGSIVNEAGTTEGNTEEDAGVGTEGAGGDSGPSAGAVVETAGTVLMGFVGFMVTFLLVFVYIFFFLMYRHKFSNTILKFVAEEKRGSTRRVISDAASISQKYMMGRLVLILSLAVLYSIGLLVSGVEHAIIIAVLAAILTLLPFVGNAVGFLLAMGMALLSGVPILGVVGVVITFVVAQFVESYVLEPYVVGDKLNLSPVMVILVVLLGETIWGLAGLAMAIPLLGIAKVVCDHVPVLEPFGYLLGQDKKKG